MRRFLLVRVVVGIAIMAVSLLGLVESVVASDDILYPWIHHDGISTISRGASAVGRPNCAVKSETIQFRSGDTKLACVYGGVDTVRVAFYERSLYWNAAAISFPGETTFVEIRGICEGSSFCGYSAAHDVFLDASRSRFYPDFAKNLVNHATPNNATPYYLFTRFDTEKAIHRSGAQRFNAASVSENGEWAIVEAYDFGLVRVNLKTFQERRVMITGAVYGLANDPWFELAVSNSGREVAITGKGASTQVIQVDEVCGDVLTPFSAASYYVLPAVPCGTVYYTETITPAHQGIHAPAFNRSGDRLSLSLERIGGWERIVIAPTVTTVNQEPFEYIALGDSFSSGEGDFENGRYRLGTDIETNKCHLSNRSYPYLMMRTWAETGNRDNWIYGQSVACSGAKTKDITGVDEYYGQKGQVPKDPSQKRATEAQALLDMHPGVLRQVDFISKYQPQFVTLSIGGNDAGLMGKLATCVGIGVCEWVKDPAKRLANAREIQALYGTIRGTIASLKEASPGVKLMVVGYPRIINEQLSAPCSLIVGALLSNEERQFIDESITLLNDTVRAAALSESVRFVDVQDAFLGNRLCEGSEKAMNGVAVGNDIAPISSIPILKIIGSESFHPTPFGHTLLQHRIVAQVPYIESAECSNCSGSISPRPLSSYWLDGVDQFLVKKQRTIDFVKDIIYRPKQAVSVSLPLMLFSQQTRVAVELHSETISFGEITTDDNGSGSINVEIPQNIESGYHTLHLVGQSWSGEEIDVYQVIRVSNEEGESPPINQSESSEAQEDGGGNSSDAPPITPRSQPSHFNTSLPSANRTIAALPMFIPVTTSISEQSSVLGVMDKMANPIKGEVDFVARSKDLSKERGARGYLVMTVVTVLVVCCVSIGIGIFAYRRYINKHQI